MLLIRFFKKWIFVLLIASTITVGLDSCNDHMPKKKKPHKKIPKKGNIPCPLKDC
ncbi:MAG: hypothetical protein NW226_25905 [Microscillaceae bacterium]|nr:hypothetical protein [Microscillaceae bacterium]